jgi:septum site-determining protein MinC
VTATALVTPEARPRPPIRVRGRSFMSFVLAPELPIADWLAELDALVRRSPAFFVDRPVIVDLSGALLDKAGLTALIADLHERGIRVFGVEGADPSALGLGLPPALSGGRSVGAVEVPSGSPPGGPSDEAPPRKPAPALMVETSVRSGQSVIFPEGDLTIIGSVGSGAEVVAGGSIHIYGALRGRAIAGTMGNTRARIFCRKLEAELLAIDGLYKTADDMPPDVLGRPMQAWLEGDAIMTAALD